MKVPRLYNDLIGKHCLCRGVAPVCFQRVADWSTHLIVLQFEFHWLKKTSPEIMEPPVIADMRASFACLSAWSLSLSGRVRVQFFLPILSTAWPSTYLLQLDCWCPHLIRQIRSAYFCFSGGDMSGELPRYHPVITGKYYLTRVISCSWTINCYSFALLFLLTIKWHVQE